MPTPEETRSALGVLGEYVTQSEAQAHSLGSQLQASKEETARLRSEVARLQAELDGSTEPEPEPPVEPEPEPEPPVEPEPEPEPEPPVEPEPPRPDPLAIPSFVPTGWKEVQTYDWKGLPPGPFTSTRQYGIVAMQSGKLVNDGLAPSDTGNSDLQKPTRPEAVEVIADPAARHGRALAVRTMRGQYETSGGTKSGWVNGRIQTDGPGVPLPLFMLTRIRVEGDLGWEAQDKSVVMVWPVPVTVNGKEYTWTWEVDIERFPGFPKTKLSVRHHKDQAGDAYPGQARPQIIEDFTVGTVEKYLWLGVGLFSDRVEYWVKEDGKAPVLILSTKDPKWVLGNGYGNIPADAKAGRFAIGRALSGPRSAHTKASALVVGEMRMYRPV